MVLSWFIDPYIIQANHATFVFGSVHQSSLENRRLEEIADRML